MSLQIEHVKPGAELRRDASQAVFATASAPFAEPLQFECDHGMTLAEMVEHLHANGTIPRELHQFTRVFVDDIECPREMWARVKPRPGRIVGVRAQPGWTYVFAALEFIWSYAGDYIIQAAIAVAATAVVGAFAGGTPEAPSFEQIANIDSSRNEFARFRKMNAVLGKFRVFPCHAAKPYTTGYFEEVELYMLLCWGVAPVYLEPDSLKIGDTPLEDFAGVTVEHKLTQADAMPKLFPSRADEGPGHGVLDFGAGWQQRTTIAEDAEEIQAEIVFTQGLVFYSGDGDVKNYSVTLRLRYREVGSSTWLGWTTNNPGDDGDLFTIGPFQRRKPFRWLFIKPNVAPGQYEVAMKRNEADQPGPKGFNEFAWVKLRTFTKQPPVLDNNLALTAVKITAGDQLQGVIDLFNGVVTRIAPLWDSVEEEFGAEGPTQNPAELVRWIACGPGAARPRNPATEVDDAALGAWAELCALRGWKCDYELRAGAGQDEIMDAVARCGRGTLVERGGKLSVVIDDVQPAPAQKFTARNMWSFRAQRRYRAETHALRLQFNNEEKDYVADEMFVYYPGYDANNAELIITYPMMGKTSPLEVYQSGLRVVAEDLLRPEDYSWRCDIENLVVKRGQRVAISHYTIAVGRRDARVAALTLNGGGTHVTAITLDEQVEQIPGDVYGLSWRKNAAGALTVEPSIALTNMGNGLGNVVTLAAVGGIPIASAPAVGDLVTFGDFGIETLDVVVQAVSRVSDFEGEIAAVPYTAEIWDGDSETLPPWSSNVSGDAFPRPPAPIIIGYNADASGIYVAYDFPIATADRVEEVEAWWKQGTDADARFELVTRVPATARIAAYPPGESGFSYQLKLVAVGYAGQRTVRTPSEIITIGSAGLGGTLSGFITNQSHVVATAADGSGGDYSEAGGTFKLFRGNVDVSGVGDPDIETSFEVVTNTAGLSISIDADTGVYAVSGLTVDQATAQLRGTNRGEQFDVIYSISKALGGVDGTPGAPGDDGAPGLNVARVRIYQRAAASPTLPSATSTFTFATGGITGLNNGWSASVPANDGNPLWISEATASGTGSTDTIASGEWASPVALVGAGLNSATVFLYQRATSAPSLPGATLTYTFSSGVLSGTLGSWSQTIPAGTNPIYVTTATALSAEATDTIASGEWAAARVLAQNGADGATGNSTDVKFIRAYAQPSTPTGDNPVGWSDGVPAGLATVWMVRGTKNSGGNLVGAWSTPQAITNFNYRGVYAGATVYSANEVVSHNSFLYICTTTPPAAGNAPSGTTANNTYWDCLGVENPGALALLNSVGTSQIDGAAVTVDKLAAGTLTIAWNLGSSAKIVLDGVNNRILVSD